MTIVKIHKEDIPLCIDVYCYVCEKSVALSNAIQYKGKYFCVHHYPLATLSLDQLIESLNVKA